MTISSPAHLRAPFDSPPAPVRPKNPCRLCGLTQPLTAVQLSLHEAISRRYIHRSITHYRNARTSTMPSFNRLIVLTILGLSVCVQSAHVGEGTGTGRDRVRWHGLLIRIGFYSVLLQSQLRCPPRNRGPSAPARTTTSRTSSSAITLSSSAGTVPTA